MSKHLVNGDFENNTTGWTVVGNTLAVSTTQAKHGSSSMRVTFNGTNTGMGTYSLTLPAAGAYSLSAYIYIPTAFTDTGSVISLAFNGFTSAVGTRFAELIVAEAARDTWIRIEVPNYAPVSGDLTGSISVGDTGSTPNNGSILYVDSVQLETGTTVTDYSPPSTSYVSSPNLIQAGPRLYTPMQRVINPGRRL